MSKVENLKPQDVRTSYQGPYVQLGSLKFEDVQYSIFSSQHLKNVDKPVKGAMGIQLIMSSETRELFTIQWEANKKSGYHEPLILGHTGQGPIKSQRQKCVIVPQIEMYSEPCFAGDVESAEVWSIYFGIHID